MSLARLRQERKSAVALLFAISAIPILGLVGLAIDYGIWNQTYASISLAASSAALNAVKIAASANLNNDANAKTEGQTAGKQWFISQVGPSDNATHFNTLHTNNVKVTVTVGATTTAVVTFSDVVPSIFGTIFGMAQYPLTVTAESEIATAPYLEVILMLDNSASMDLAATPSAMSTLEPLTACDSSNAFYVNNGTTWQQAITNVTSNPMAYWTAQSGDQYTAYQCSGNGQTYNQSFAAGLPACPATAPSALYQFNPVAYTSTGPTTPDTFPTFGSPYTLMAPPNETCQTATSAPSKDYKGTSYYPLPGPPCTFACHWTNTLSSDNKTTADLFGLARRNGIQLRIDLVKNATQMVLQQMATDTVSTLKNLSVGVYTFNTAVTQIYPDPTTCGAPGSASCEAGTDFGTAENLVGTPPQYPAVADTGMQPHIAQRTGNNDDTAFPEDMASLYNTYVTKAGNGGSAASPRKVLFLVTDGVDDDPNDGLRQAFQSSACANFKNLYGYQIYVVYTPYYPVQHSFYYSSNMRSYVEQTGSTSISYQLQACSSDTNTNSTYYISAADGTTLNNALVGFLKNAEQSPARFTE